eukprot:sb/3468954/
MGGILRHRTPPAMTRDSTERVSLLTEKKEPCGPAWKCLPLSEVAQIIPPFFLAGFGTLAAGLLLDEVQNWRVFQAIGELFVLVPALLGLKGNLAMTLASRLSTEAHRGIQEPVSVVSGYLALDQAQALIVGLLASMIALVTVFCYCDDGPPGIFCQANALTTVLARSYLKEMRIGSGQCSDREYSICINCVDSTAGLANGTTVTNMVVLIATGLITASFVSIILVHYSTSCWELPLFNKALVM